MLIPVKKLYITAQGHIVSDIVNFSIQLKPETNEDDALGIVSALSSCMAGQIIKIGWKPKKPFWEAILQDWPLPHHAMSMLRWQIGLTQKYTYISAYSGNHIDNTANTTLSIPFADPYFEIEDTKWLGKSWYKRQSPRPISIGWKKIEDALLPHVKIGWHSRIDSVEPGSLESVKFKASYVNTFVKNIT